jgi:hypothetical protein
LPIAYKTMRNSPIESLLIGGGIALGVLLVHALTQGAPALVQLLALLAAGVVLFCVQLVLALRRAPPPHRQDEPQRRFGPLRQRRRNMFARELTHDWTGLEDHPAERDAASPYAPDGLDDELWGESPEVTVRKTLAKKVDDPHT